MRLAVSCPACISGAIDRNASPEEMRRIHNERVAAQITHERSTVATCRNNHTFGIVVGEPAFALVFERGLQRLVDGDLRDAVLDAYTGLDMYTPIVPVRARYDSDRSLGPKDIPRLRKELGFTSSDANKALGAAFAVASVVSGKPPPKFNSKLARLRNEAIHAGHYPSAEDAKWAILEVERIVTELDELLGQVDPDRDPPFRLAVEMVDFPRTGQANFHTTLLFSAVLSGVTKPRETVDSRLARYRNGELENIRLY